MSNKRQPKKTGNKRRSLRKRNTSDLEEEKEYKFRKPTPQKYQKIDEDEAEFGSQPLQSGYKVILEGVNKNSESSNVRRSGRKRTPVIDKGKSHI